MLGWTNEVGHSELRSLAGGVQYVDTQLKRRVLTSPGSESNLGWDWIAVVAAESKLPACAAEELLGRGHAIG